jgi:succinoglycan biosynthesis protein ExoM
MSIILNKIEKLSICICTKNRHEGLKNLLLSIFDTNTNDINITISITIVENDHELHIKDIVRELQVISPFKINYYLEENIGISSARNRAIKESRDSDYCVFTDDDQVVDKEWIRELIRCQNEFNADGVYGLTPPIFTNEVPLHISSFYKKRIIPYGTKLKCAATGCLLLKISFLHNHQIKFDERLNFLGGEDVLLTNQIVNKGGILINNSNAISYECIPQERLTLKYIIKRTFRNAVTHITVSKYLKVSISTLLREMVMAVIKVIYGALVFLPFYIIGENNKLKGVILVVKNIGILYSICGKTISFYK